MSQLNTEIPNGLPVGSTGSPLPAMAGSGGAVSAPTPSAPPTPSQPHEVDINLNDVLTVGDISAPISELVAAYRAAKQAPTHAQTPQVQQQMSAQPTFVEQLYQRAVAGDRTAANQLFDMAYPNQRPQQVQQPVATAPVEPPKPTTIAGMSEAELREMKAYVDQQKNAAIKAGIAEQIKVNNFHALGSRDDAVDQVISQVDAHVRMFQASAGREPTAIEAGQMLRNIMTQLNEREAAYQQKLLRGLGNPNQNAGSLGVSDPFRGGSSQVVVGERPQPGTKEYSKWLNTKFQLARSADAQGM